MSKAVRIYEYDPSFSAFTDHIGANVRALEREEARLVGATITPGYVTSLCEADPENSFVVFLGSEPVFALGTLQVIPGVRHVWGFGTDRCARAMPAMTRHLKSILVPAMYRLGVRRVQVHVPLSCEASWLWLQNDIGFRVESVMNGFCIDGSPLVQLAFNGPPQQSVGAYTNEGTPDNVFHEST